MDKQIIGINFYQISRTKLINFLEFFFETNTSKKTLPNKKILVAYEGRKIIGRKFYVQKYDKELFIPKSPCTIFKNGHPYVPSRKIHKNNRTNN
jgi:hypothetical protein